MSFVKHAIFVDSDAPNLNDFNELGKYVLNRITSKSLFLAKVFVISLIMQVQILVLVENLALMQL